LNQKPSPRKIEKIDEDLKKKYPLAFSCLPNVSRLTYAAVQTVDGQHRGTPIYGYCELKNVFRIIFLIVLRQ